jgi:flagellar P-ring protein precursor FlgI
MRSQPMRTSNSQVKGFTLLIAACWIGLSLTVGVVQAELRIGSICRVKGQERNTLHGYGLVVGLKGTGDGKMASTIRSLARNMQLAGVPLVLDQSTDVTAVLQDAKNVALVSVVATVPAQGARQGDEIDCTVNAISAKSLEGGTLLPTPMLGPRPAAKPELAPVYAFAQGGLHLEDDNTPTTAKISMGCRFEETIFNPFVKDGKLTLVLNNSHSGFAVAQDIEDTINRQPDLIGTDSQSTKRVARAIDQMNIEVEIPSNYRDDPVLFASQILGARLFTVATEARVVVNQRAGLISVGADVEIAPTAVTHEDMVVEIGEGTVASQFVGLDPSADVSAPKLKALVEALNTLQVPAKEMIEIIRVLDARGAIYGHVIYK